MNHADPAHLCTALAYYVIGGLLTWGAVRLWRMSDIERVDLLGPFVTEAGWRLVLEHWWLVFMFGAFILSCAFDHNVDWARAGGHLPLLITAQLCAALAQVEAVIAGATAAGVGVCAWRIVRRACRT